MNASERNIPDRAHELLADRACFGLSREEERELRELLAQCPECLEWLEVSPHDLVAGEVAAGCPCEASLPPGLRLEIEVQARAWCRGVKLVRGESPTERAASSTRWRALALTGWMAAAACLVVAVGLVLRGGGGGATHAEKMALATSRGEVVKAGWGPFNALDSGEPPEISGVSGEVAWSDKMQTGTMTFRGLPACKSGEHYQLWIIDAERGLSQRVSGAVFGCPGPAEIEVPIQPQLPIGKAAAFAVTIEREGGVVVSDMKRRVVLASLAR
ncbi:MAG: anti-sigma factor [Phycisphaerae bacterium]|nr:anti-sigma factor [Phycisphaerae bacterium]